MAGGVAGAGLGEQVGDVQAKGLLERDVGNVLAFFKRKYGLERDVGMMTDFKQFL